jgi:hypothetical protein
MVRIGALDMLASAEPQEIWLLAAPLLSDPVRCFSGCPRSC